MIRVEVVYALPGTQRRYTVELEQGATLLDAIRRCGVLAEFPAIDLATQRAGVFGRTRPLDARVEHGDRVELYRPLTADPKEARRRRARGA